MRRSFLERLVACAVALSCVLASFPARAFADGTGSEVGPLWTAPLGAYANRSEFFYAYMVRQGYPLTDKSNRQITRWDSMPYNYQAALSTSGGFYGAVANFTAVEYLTGNYLLLRFGPDLVLGDIQAELQRNYDKLAENSGPTVPGGGGFGGGGGGGGSSTPEPEVPSGSVLEKWVSLVPYPVYNIQSLSWNYDPASNYYQASIDGITIRIIKTSYDNYIAHPGVIAFGGAKCGTDGITWSCSNLNPFNYELITEGDITVLPGAWTSETSSDQINTCSFGPYFNGATQYVRAINKGWDGTGTYISTFGVYSYKDTFTTTKSYVGGSVSYFGTLNTVNGNKIPGIVLTSGDSAWVNGAIFPARYGNGGGGSGGGGGTVEGGGIPEPSTITRPESPASPTNPTTPERETQTIIVNGTTQQVPAPAEAPDLSTIEDLLRRILANTNTIIEQMNSFSSQLGQQIADFYDAVYDWFGVIDTRLRDELAYWHSLYEWMGVVWDWLSAIDQDIQYLQSICTTGFNDVVSWLQNIFNRMTQAGTSGGSKPSITDPDDTSPVMDWLRKVWADFLADLQIVLPDQVGAVVDFLDQLRQKFPFSIPWDIAAMLALLNHDPVTPVIDLPWGFAGGIQYVHVDLHGWDDAVEIIRPMFLLLFALGLALLTRDLLAGLEAIL